MFEILPVAELFLRTIFDVGAWLQSGFVFRYIDANGVLQRFSGDVWSMILGGGLVFILGFRLVKFFTDLIL